MADAWAQDAVARTVLEEASSVIGRDVVAAARDEAALATTEFVQPALLAIEVAASRVLEAAGPRSSVPRDTRWASSRRSSPPASSS